MFSIPRVPHPPLLLHITPMMSIVVVFPMMILYLSLSIKEFNCWIDKRYSMVHISIVGQSTSRYPSPDSSVDLSTVVRLVNSIHETLTKTEETLSKSVSDSVIKPLTDNMLSIISDMCNPFITLSSSDHTSERNQSTIIFSET